MSEGTVKKIMYVNRKAPYGTIYALESLEVVLIAAAFDQDVSLVFMDDGVIAAVIWQGRCHGKMTGTFREPYKNVRLDLGGMNRITVSSCRISIPFSPQDGEEEEVGVDAVVFGSFVAEEAPQEGGFSVAAGFVVARDGREDVNCHIPVGFLAMPEPP